MMSAQPICIGDKFTMYWPRKWWQFWKPRQSLRLFTVIAETTGG